MALSNHGSGYDVVYGAVLSVHIASAVAGFGMLGLSGLYGSAGSHLHSPKEVHDVRQFFAPRNRIGRSLWFVPFAGAIALWLEHGAAALGQAWVGAAVACWAVAMVAAIWVVWPAEHRIRSVVVALDEAPDGEEAAGRRAALAALCRPVVHAAALCDVVFVIAVALMVLKPGT
ncbi:MAG: hypothetical protein ACRDZ8_00760 [Acidimicrobiales bacterium]